MAHKRTLPKQRPGDWTVSSCQGGILRQTGGHIVSPKWSSSHDNGKCPVSRGGAEKLYVRVPSIKRSVKVWKNFYHLFPWIYLRMREAAETKGVTDGIMTMPWPTQVNLISETGRWTWAPYNRTVKVRVLDLTGEFTQMSRKLANQTLYRGFDSTILNKGSKRNRSFTQRNIDIYIKQI